MALHYRKLLQDDKKPDETDKKYESPCFMCYVCPDDCSLYVSPPPPLQPASKTHQMSIILILMLCILGAAFLLLSYLTIGRYRLRRRRSSASASFENREDFLDEDQGPVLDHPIWYIRTIGLSQSVIDSIAVFKYKKGEGLIDGRDCSVCLSEFQEDESLRLLPKCSHAFHLPCIDTWLRSHQNCPVCRAPILISNTGMNTNTGRVEPVDTSTSVSGSREENRMVEPNETREGRDVTENISGTRSEDNKLSKDGSSTNARGKKLRVLSDLADHHRVKVDQEVQPMRRSFSMDFSSDSMIYAKKDEGCLDIKVGMFEKQNLDMIDKSGSKNSGIYNKLIKSSSHGRSIQNIPISMKRSFSFSGRRSSRKHSRSVESISIPEINSTQNCNL